MDEQEVEGVPEQQRDHEVDEITDRLTSKFAGADGPLSVEDVADAVHDAADHLRDAPIQAFVPLITENVARNQLQDQVDEESHDP